MEGELQWPLSQMGKTALSILLPLLFVSGSRRRPKQVDIVEGVLVAEIRQAKGLLPLLEAMQYIGAPDRVGPEALHLLGTLLLVLQVVEGNELVADGRGAHVARGRVAVGLQSAVAHVHGWEAGEGAAEDELLGAGAEGEGLAGGEVEGCWVVDGLDVEVGEELRVQGVLTTPFRSQSAFSSLSVVSTSFKPSLAFSQLCLTQATRRGDSARSLSPTTGKEKLNMKTVGLELLDQLDQIKLSIATVGVQSCFTAPRILVTTRI